MAQFSVRHQSLKIAISPLFSSLFENVLGCQFKAIAILLGEKAHSQNGNYATVQRKASPERRLCPNSLRLKCPQSRHWRSRTQSTDFGC
jgi:hypothetical protein